MRENNALGAVSASYFAAPDLATPRRAIRPNRIYSISYQYNEAYVNHESAAAIFNHPSPPDRFSRADPISKPIALVIPSMGRGRSQKRDACANRDVFGPLLSRNEHPGQHRCQCPNRIGYVRRVLGAGNGC